MWLQKIVVLVLLFIGFIVTVATSPQSTIGHSTVLQHISTLDAEQDKLWLYLELESNQAIQTKDFYQSEIHFEIMSTHHDTATAEQDVISELSKWQAVFYDPLTQEVFWIEDLPSEKSSYSDMPIVSPTEDTTHMEVSTYTAIDLNLSLQPCSIKQEIWSAPCLPCSFSQGSCKLHMYIMRTHYPKPAKNINITVQQISPKKHSVVLSLDTASSVL